MAREKILIVEDDAILGAYFQEALKRFGYDVVHPVATADEAIFQAGQIHPDLILMDINLPGRMNGIQAAGEIRGLCDAAVIFLTGYSQDARIQEVKDIGPYGYLIKPVSEHELAAAIETALYKHDLDRKLKESEERYHRITAAVTDYIFTVDIENGRAAKTIHSPTCEGVTGYTAEDFAADPNLRLAMVPEHDREAVRKQAEDILEGRAFEAVEHRIIRKDAGMRWVRETLVPHYDKKGRLISYDGLIQDITGRKQAEEALRASKEQYQTLFETSPDPIIMSDLKGEFIMVNRQTARLYGVETPEEFKAAVKSFMDLLDGDGRKRARQRIKNLVHAKTVPKIEYSFKTKDGSIIIGEVNTSVVSNRDNKPIALLSIIHDITRRKQMEDAVRNSEERFRTLVEHMQDSLIILDFSGRILFANPAAAHLVGLQNIEEAIGEDITCYLYPDSIEQAKAHLEEIRLGKEVLSSEYHIMTKDGRHRWVEGLGTKIFYQGAPSDLVLLRDITERRQLQDTLREREENLRSLFNNMMEGVALHELIRDAAGTPIDYRVIEINPQYESILGLRQEDVRGKNATAIYDSPQAPYLDVYAKVARTGISMKFETYYAPFDKYLEISVAPWGKNGFTTIFSDITGRKRAQEELRTSEERYRTLVETQTEFISRFKPDGTLVFVNEVFQRFLGKPENELVGRILNFIVYPEDLPMIKSRLSEISQSNPVVAMECRLVSGTGEINWIQFVNRGLYDHEGTLVEIQSVGRDITERKRSEDALRASKAKLEAVFDSMNDAVFISDVHGNFVDFNEAFTTYYRFSSKEECCRTLDEIPHYIDIYFADGTPAPMDMWSIARALRGETESNAEYILRKKDTGDTWWGSYSFGPIRDRDGVIIGSVVVARDITERKRADEELQRLASAMEQADECVIITDTQGAIQYVNPAFEKITGYTRDDAIGQNPRMLKSGMQDEAFYKELWGVITKGRTWSGRLVNRRKNGTLYY
ncbi:MAG: PAS domain S-box protein, partial [Syntrophaceae bacterium]